MPSLSHAASDNVPRFDGSIVNDELVLALILGLCGDLNRPLDVGEGVVYLVEVTVTLKLHILDLSLLDARLSEEGPAEELVLLVDSLEENVSHSARGVIAFVGKQGHLDVHYYHLWGQLRETFSWVFKDNLLCFVHAGVHLYQESLIFLRILDVEGGVLK